MAHNAQLNTVGTTPQLDPHAPYTYHGVPSLRQLMTRTGGVPGVAYLQCAVANLKRAQNEGWGRIEGRAQRVYTIVGPKGQVDCELYCQGTPIPGQGTDSGARRCEVDLEIYNLTGLDEEEPTEQNTKPVDKPMKTAKVSNEPAKPANSEPQRPSA